MQPEPLEVINARATLQRLSRMQADQMNAAQRHAEVHAIGILTQWEKSQPTFGQDSPTVNHPVQMMPEALITAIFNLISQLGIPLENPATLTITTTITKGPLLSDFKLEVVGGNGPVAPSSSDSVKLSNESKQICISCGAILGTKHFVTCPKWYSTGGSIVVDEQCMNG